VKNSKLDRELRKLESSFNPMADEMTTEANFVFTTELCSDPDEPKTFDQAFFGPDKKFWKPSLKEEAMKFIKRKAWKKVEREAVRKLGRKPIGTTWVFKVKNAGWNQKIQIKMRYKRILASSMC
jgi:hypothetical protein